MRVTIIFNSSKRFVQPKKTIGTGKRLNNIFILEQFIQIKRIDPFGVKSRQHLIDHNQKIELFFRFSSNAFIRFFMRKSGGNIFLHSGKSGNTEMLPVARIIVLNNFFQPGLLVESLCGIIIINIRVKQGGNFEFCIGQLKQTIVFYSFRNG